MHEKTLKKGGFSLTKQVEPSIKRLVCCGGIDSFVNVEINRRIIK